MRQTLLRVAGLMIFKLRGWSFDPIPTEWVPKQVLIAFPHTALADTAMALAGFAIIRQKGHVIMKREAFRWPLSSILRRLGAIPVDRSTSNGVVEQMVREFASREAFQLALVPEGTRRGCAKVRTGFWHIAKAAQVPIVCWYIDSEGKRTRWVGRLNPSDDVEADLRLIKQMYAAAGHVIDAIADAAPAPAPLVAA